MMNGPYYRNHSRSVPVHKPKVVSIPVHFVSSDHHQPQTITNKHSSSSSAAALKIQKVFKGHTVRKALEKIVSIKNQVDQIEKRLRNDVGFVKTLRNDAKERLRVNEALMSLLLKLDSVNGVGDGVREVRKSVAKRADALQERVDSIGQSFEEGDDDVSTGEKTEPCDVGNGSGNGENEEDAKEEGVVDDGVFIDEKTELCDVSNENHDQELVVNGEVMNEDSMRACDDDVIGNNADSINQAFNEGHVDDVVNGDETELRDVSKVNEEYAKDVVDDDDGNNNVGSQESLIKESSMKKCGDDVSRGCCDHEIMAVNEDRKCGDDGVSRSCCDKGMVEKLMCDNAKMMRLMIQISERNEMQTRMINSMSKRVEHLEKAFIMTDKSRRRKKTYNRREKDGFCI